MRKKIGVMLLLISTNLWADLALEEGVYISSECNITIKIGNNKGYFYAIDGIDDGEKYPIIPIEEGWSLTKYFYCGSKDENVFIVPDNKNGFAIQNRWDNSSKIAFKGCSKTLNYVYVDSVQTVEKKMKELKGNNSLNREFFYALVEAYPLRANNVTAYNNIAYYLEQKGAYDKALMFLDLIVKRFPNRMVTHLNYANTLLKMKESEKEEAEPHYLTYISKMLKEHKANRIPRKLKKKYKKYYKFLKKLNSTLKNSYQILDMMEGDINDDSQKDISVVIEYTDSSKIEKSYSIWERPSNKNARVWLMFLGEKKEYKLFTKNEKLIEADEYTNCDDNFDGIRMKGKNLFLDTHFWCSAGGWEQGSEHYQFIYRNNEIILAGSESEWSHRATTKGVMKSANFLTKKLKIQATIDFGGAEGKAKWHKIKIDKPIKFEEYSRELERKLIGG